MAIISIHAPRAGGDGKKVDWDKYTDISIHAPRAGGDGEQVLNTVLKLAFQSTPPVRGATLNRQAMSFQKRFQSTPPVRGATDIIINRAGMMYISIHAPRAGGDAFPASYMHHIYISIHAPRAGGDFDCSYNSIS